MLWGSGMLRGWKYNKKMLGFFVDMEKTGESHGEVINNCNLRLRAFSPVAGRKCMKNERMSHFGEYEGTTREIRFCLVLELLSECAACDERPQVNMSRRTGRATTNVKSHPVSSRHQNAQQVMQGDSALEQTFDILEPRILCMFVWPFVHIYI